MPLTAATNYDRFGRRAVAGLIGFGALLMGIAIIAASMTLGSITEDTDRVEHTLEVQASIQRLAAYNEQIETGRRGFLIQPDPSFSRIIRDASTDYAAEQAALEQMVSDNYEQSERVARIKQLATEREILIDRLFASPESSVTRILAEDFDAERGVVITRDIRHAAEKMAEEEKELLRLRNRSQLESLIQFYVVGGLALILLLAVMIAVIVLVLRYNRDLASAQLGLKQANEGLEEAVSNRTAELSRANQEIQRFAYIVSHDLRSPLVNVLGFTAELDEARKLIRQYLEGLFEKEPEKRDEQVWLAVDEDLPEALDFIRSSTEKMDRLINSILELSRQGRRQLEPEMLDMDDLAEGVVASLRQQAESANASVIVKAVPDVESDRIAVEQILSNLIENALKYLSPARSGEVVVRGKEEGGKVHIDVIDNGRGIAPEDHERVFDLFRRAGTQDQPGEGIGLANVRALAYRLGGTIELESELDRGSRFRLTLPARFVAAETST